MIAVVHSHLGNAASPVRYDDLEPLHVPCLRIAREHPDRPAVVGDGVVLSYGELAARAGEVAAELTRDGVGRGALVGVCLERSAEAVVALLGTLAAGAAFVPLDPRWPLARIRAVTVHSGAAVVLTGAELTEVRADVPGARTLPSASATTELPAVPVTDAAFVYYTSGSTGAPKGVVVDHRCAAGRVRTLLLRFPLAVGDRIPFKTPLSFDVAIWDVFGPLTAGATIEVVPPHGEADVAGLHTVLQGPRLVGAHFVPSMLDAYLRYAPPGGYPGLRWVMTSGEAVPGHLLSRFDEHFPPHVEFHNLYGQTETSEVTGWTGRSWPGAHVPIGRQIGEYRVQLLDADLRPVPPGAPGEICVCAPGGLAHGYLGRPALTAEKFVPHPEPLEPGERLYRTGDLGRMGEDGEIVFTGRVDRQLKVWGARVEPAEVEGVLLTHPGVTGCAVVLDRRVPETPELVAYITGDAAPEALRRHVAERLAWYLVPSAYVRLGVLPLLPSGKLDVAALPPPDPGDRATTGLGGAPRTALQSTLAALWSEVLKVREAGPDDNFFAVGGTSLKATVYLHAVHAETGTLVPASEFFAAPTIAGLARTICTLQEGDG